MSIRLEKKINRIQMNVKKIGPKTFKSEELANKWAKDQDISKFTLVNIRHLGAKDKKIKVVPE